MGRLNWSGFNGAEFESLVHSLLFFDEPGIVLFGRPGKDSGQDAISGDGSHVYQAKYRQALKFDEAISLCRTELNNVRKHLNPDDNDYPFWSKVNHWTLVANCEANPFDKAKWEKMIVSEYSDLKLELDYWDATKLESLLTQYPDVEQAFFTGRNRSFAGLWEARRFLEQGISGEYFFGTKTYGWETQFQKLDEFAESEQCRFLFVHGPAAIGKTRFLYESATRLSEKGWRAFWGLPASMSLSDAWMKGITDANGKICLLVDAPTSKTLVDSIYEQLSTVDKRSWKVVVSCQQPEFNNWFGTNSLRRDTDSIELSALSEDATKGYVEEFGKNYDMHLPPHASEGLYELTQGIPGWLGSILGYSHKTHTALRVGVPLLQMVNEQVQKAFGTWDSATRERRLAILRWICVVKTIVTETSSGAANPLITFLAQRLQIQSGQIYDDLKELSHQGLLFAWGRNRRFYTAEPMLVRQQILSEWLLERFDSSYRVSEAGRDFIQQLLKSEIPNKETIVRNLSELTASYLGKDQGADFFKPIIDELKTEAKNAEVTQQFSVFEWAKLISCIDPESSLEIVLQIWNRPTPPKTIKHKYWGDQTLEHAQLLSDIPWFLYSLAEQRTDNAFHQTVWLALRRAFEEENNGNFSVPMGQEPEKLIKRLLQKPNAHRYQELAFEELTNDCEKGRFSQFDLTIAAGLLSCRRETIESFRRHVVFSRSYLQPGTPEWKRAIDTRALLFGQVEFDKSPQFSAAIWSLLADAHYEWRPSELTDVDGAKNIMQRYDDVILDDLRRTRDIITNRGKNIGQMELQSARKLWATALKREEGNEENRLATECEDEFKKHYLWDFSSLFSWDLFDDDLAQVVAPVKKYFASATDPQEISAFFEEAAKYLRSNDPKRPDEDYGKSYDLAIACSDLYAPTGDNAFSKFVEENIQSPTGTNLFRDRFFVHFLRRWIWIWKNKEPAGCIVDEIRRLVGSSKGKENLLVGIYAGTSSAVIGTISRQELLYVCSSECKFDNRQLAMVLPSFLGVDSNLVLERFGRILDEEAKNHEELERLWWSFAFNSYLVVIRAESNGFPSPIGWLMESFGKYGINGDYLARHELQHLAHRSGYKLSQREFVDFIKCRIKLENSSSLSTGFTVMPHHFEVAKWVSLQTDERAIHALCSLSVEETTFLAVYQLPEYIAVLDQSGNSIATFVSTYLSTDKDAHHLRRLGGLGSHYEEGSAAWKKIVQPICHYMNGAGMARSDRFSVYRSFQPAMRTWSSSVGEVPVVLVEKEASTKKALKETPIDSDFYEYFVWAHNRADWELKSAQEEVEGESHE